MAAEVPMIEFRSVTKRYGDRAVVDGLDLAIDRGRITVFVGPSGCGKTTCLRMVNRMVAASEGAILLDGRDTAPIPDHVLRRGMGYVLQQAGLMPHRTIADNVATVPVLLGTPRKKARQDALELLERVGLDPAMAGRYPAQLSGGQQQRVGVARALAADPPVLLMDEAFSAVDPVVREELQQELLRLQAELGKTIVFVTHDIDEAVLLGDKVVVFDVGARVAQHDTPERILKDPADTYVANFVGRDRGFRHLSFVEGRSVPVHAVATASPEAPSGPAPDAAGAASWRLAVDDSGRPLGWYAPGQARGTRPVAGGSLYTRGSSLRGALDAALSSPSGEGVVVDDEGRAVGVVRGSEILELLERHRRMPTAAGRKR